MATPREIAEEMKAKADLALAKVNHDQQEEFRKIVKQLSKDQGEEVVRRIVNEEIGLSLMIKSADKYTYDTTPF